MLELEHNAVSLALLFVETVNEKKLHSPYPLDLDTLCVKGIHAMPEQGGRALPVTV